ncbi:MAG: hybrid sensor histidine kinase/response regulator [Moraxellaceae bacterium]|nr:MAG: hybrid sensor histidine kinase/response regulator [Moraxellaceae bacterium]
MAQNPLTREQTEMLEMLAGELQSQLEFSLGLPSGYDQSRLQELADVVDSFASAAELMGLTGLANSWHYLKENLQLLSQQDQLEADQILLLDSWIMYYLDFLQQLCTGEVSSTSITAVIEFLAHPSWPKPLTQDQQIELSQQLLLTEVVVLEDAANRLPTIATESMLSLALGDEINPDLFEGLMIELPGQVTHFSEYLNHFIATQDKAALQGAQRVAHTLKGSANVVGISGIANFMHFSEDLLEEISRHEGSLNTALKNLLIDMADTLAAMLDNLMTGDSVGSVELDVMQQVLDAYHLIHENGLDAFLVNERDVNPIEIYQQSSVDQSPVTSSIVTEAAQTGTDVPHMHTTHLQETLASQLRIKEETAQDLLRLAGESAISTNRLQTQVHDVKDQLQHIGQLHNKLTQLTEEFGQLIEVRELFNSRSKSMNDDGLDPLELDRYNELHSFFHQLQEFAIDTRDAIHQTQGQLRSLEDLTYEQQVTNRASQSHLLEMRMIPASNMEARFQRCVRQACRLTGKQANFQLRGGDTMIDSRVLHELVDPLMHLLRNAVDHGIEESVERQAIGKPAEGTVELQFSVQGQSIVVRVTDDGAGLNRERIAEKAKELSLAPPTDTNPDITELWLKQLIFAAGFSTRNQVSQTSGRGIGLDMVADRVNELKGRISVNSNPSRGCEFSIRLPMPMIAEHGILVTSGKHRIAIAARGIEQLLFLENNSLTNYGDQLRYRFDQHDIDVFHISQLAQLPGSVAINAIDAHALLVVETLPGQHVGVLIERVIASREMVVKPLTAFTPIVPGIIGATILGDGEVAPVIDVQQLALDLLQRGVTSATWNSEAMRMSQKAAVERPMALVVDDSLSTRRSLAQFVGDMGMEVRTAKDGFEAIEILQEQTPHIILVDMEMPRMNGLELTAHVRANEITKHVPVIMITSRNTEKHRNLATAAGVDTYLNKPFSEEELMHHIQESMHS